MTDSTPAAEAARLERAAVRKVSRRLIPFLFLLYIGAYLDRINVGFAALTMKQDLGFSDSVYGFGAGVFFLGYFLFEVPSNLILARTGARRWIARIMISWAVISSAMAFVRTPMAFYSLRFLLGLAEAGFFPGVIFYLGYWFPAAQRAAAVSRFMTAVAVAGIVGGPLSGALLQLDGVMGLRGWQWIFLAEGVPSLVLGVLVLLYLPDCPAQVRWLAPEERDALTARLREEEEQVARQGGHMRVGQALRHGTVWRLALLYFMFTTSLYSISLWLPEIIRGFSGLSNLQVAFLSAIPYLAAAVAMVLVGMHSDRRNERRLHVAAMALVAAVGMAASGLAHSPVLGIAAMSVATIGTLGAFGPFWALPTAFLSGTAAAGGIALINSLGNLGGFLGPYLIGRVRDATGSFAGSLSAIALLLLVGAGLALGLRRSDARLAPHPSEFDPRKPEQDPAD